MKIYKIYVDGSGKGNFCFFCEDTNETKIGHETGITNNQAEYLAVNLALMVYRTQDLEILSDSQLVVNQLNHEWSIKNDKLRQLAIEIWSRVGGIRKVTFNWIPREQNKAGKILG